MNQPYQTNNLRSQRFFLHSGSSSIPQLCHETLNTISDANYNFAICYDKKFEDRSKNIKLSHPLSYLVYDSEAINKIKLDLSDSFIQQSHLFALSLINRKQAGEEINQPKVDQLVNYYSKFKVINYKEHVSQIDEQKCKELKDSDKGEPFKVLLQLFQIFKKVIQQKEEASKNIANQYKQIHQKYNLFEKQILALSYNNELYEFHLDVLEQISQRNQLYYFIFQSNNYLTKMIDFESKGNVILFQPLIHEYYYLINPISLSIFYNLFLEMTNQEQTKRKKNYANKIDENVIFPLALTHSVYLQKIVFINLDGEDAIYDMDLFRCFSRLLMYISFPKNYANYNNKQMNQQAQYQSQISLKNYFISQELNKIEIAKKMDQLQNRIISYNPQASQESIRRQKSSFKQFLESKQAKIQNEYSKFRNKIRTYGSDKSVNKNIFTFPINNQSLKAQHPGSKYFNNGTLQHYESNFVYYCMMSIMLKRIQQFVPSLIVISYNGRVHLDNYHFEDIIKTLAVEVDSRILFYPNMGNISKKIGQNQTKHPNIQDFKKQQYKRYKQYYLNINSNKDVLDKVAIFHTVVEGKNNLSSLPCANSDVQKFRNIQIQPYITEILQMMSPSNQSIKQSASSSTNSQTQQAIIKSYQYSKYGQQFQNDSFIKRLLNALQTLIFSQMEQESEYSDQVKYLRSKYSAEELAQIFKVYSQELFVRELSRKQRKAVYLKIPSNKYDVTNPTDSLYIVKFITQSNGRQTQVFPAEGCQVLYSSQSRRKGKQSGMVYVMNHLVNNNQYKNYYGTLNYSKKQVESGCIPVQIVQLFELSTFNQKEINNQFQIYRQWNYFETTNKSILYWPVKFDFISYHLSQLTKISDISKTILIHQMYILDAHFMKQQPLTIRTDFNEKQQYHLTKCNCVSYQNEDNLQLYLFGGYNYKELYQSSNTQIIRVQLNKLSKQYKFHSLSFQSSILPQFSQFQIIKQVSQKQKKQRVFLAGGYGYPHFTQYHSYTSYFYEVYFTSLNFSQSPDWNKKYIIRHNIRFNQNINEEVPYDPINIKQPLKLPHNMVEYSIVQRYPYYRISPDPEPCLMNQSYLIRNYLYYIIEEEVKIRHKTTTYTVLKMIKPFMEYNIVDSQYYTYSSKYLSFLEQNHLSTYLPDQRISKIAHSKINNISLQLPNSHRFQQYQYVFAPSQELISIRENKYNEMFIDDHFDTINRVESYDCNNGIMGILFKNQRITDGKWVVGFTNISGRDINKTRRWIVFQELARLDYFVGRWEQSKYLLNILDKRNIFVSEHYGNSLVLYQIEMENSQQYVQDSKQSKAKQVITIESQYSNFLTYTYDNYIVILSYKYISQNIQFQLTSVKPSENNRIIRLGSYSIQTYYELKQEYQISINGVEGIFASQNIQQCYLIVELEIKDEEERHIGYLEIEGDGSKFEYP